MRWETAQSVEPIMTDALMADLETGKLPSVGKGSGQHLSDDVLWEAAESRREQALVALSGAGPCGLDAEPRVGHTCAQGVLLERRYDHAGLMMAALERDGDDILAWMS